jgi:L-ascorbate metabolism protein UlaG (beta-lactamase superfamily)
MKIRFLGHSCFEIIIGKYNLVFDPFISGNSKASHIDIKSLKPNFILLSHGHADHVMDAEAIARASGAKIISNYEVVSWYKGMGLDGHEMNHGGSWDFDFGRVKYVNAVHSSMLPDGSYGGNPGGFVVKTAEGQFYFAGDTAVYSDMKLIPQLCGKIDFAILPIGSNFTMDYQEALLASDFIECDKILGCHFDTFPYIEINHQEVQAAFKSKGKEMILLNIGETIEI